MKFDLTKMLKWIFECRYFGPDPVLDGGTAIPYVWDQGSKDSRLVLVLGDNAGGKSFFRRLVSIVTYGGPHNKPGKFPVRETLRLSMEDRAGHNMYGMARAMVYGDEEYNATGQLTAHTVEGAITTATGRDHDIIVYWDEPDIGMSARSAAGVGLRIQQFVNSMPSNVKAVFVTSHSPVLVDALLQAHEKPHYIYLGDDQGPATGADWVVAQQNPIPILPEDLSRAGHTRFKAIQKIINDLKATKTKDAS